VSRYVARAGRSPAIVHYFRRWTGEPTFDPAVAGFVHDLGAVPMISWEPWQGLDAIVDGAWDAVLADYARAVADHGQPLLLRFAHEMNLPQIPWFGPAATFRAAWERVRAAFDDAGATNVRWVWSPYANGPGVAELSEYFPGTGLVDWPALDGYNWGRSRPWQRWPSFERLFGASLATITELMPGAPVMLAEIGCATRGGDKAAWMRETLLHAIPERHPEIRAVVWFDHHRPEHADWRIDSSPDSLAAWREAIADPRYQLSAGELLRLPRP
jgi:mannan endo-1,4-beta-mannosidase